MIGYLSLMKDTKQILYDAQLLINTSSNKKQMDFLLYTFIDRVHSKHMLNKT